MSVRMYVLSVRMEQLGSHWTDFRKLLCKSFKKIQVLLQSDKNNRYFLWWPMHIYDIILLNSFQSEKFFRWKL
jgi:hypothetical protein